MAWGRSIRRSRLRAGKRQQAAAVQGTFGSAHPHATSASLSSSITVSIGLFFPLFSLPANHSGNYPMELNSTLSRFRASSVAAPCRVLGMGDPPRRTHASPINATAQDRQGDLETQRLGAGGGGGGENPAGRFHGTFGRHANSSVMFANGHVRKFVFRGFGYVLVWGCFFD